MQPTHLPSSPPAAGRLPTLTGLRFAAALAVFLTHAAMPLPLLRLLADDEAAHDFSRATTHTGSIGVAFFFVLSGFVLSWSARPGDTMRSFWRRRFVKIYPNYAITWALAMLVFAAAYTPSRTAIANLLMVHVWIPDFDYLFSVNTPSWSLGCELFFYASFPLLHRLFARIRPERLVAWIAAVALAVIATPWVAETFLPDHPAVPVVDAPPENSTLQYWFMYFLPPVRMLDFILGMLLARAVLAGRLPKIGMVCSGVLLAGSYVLALHVPIGYAQRSVAIVPIALLVAAAARADLRGSFTPFRNRVAVRLGEISFAFYLLHFVVLVGGRKLLPDGRMYSVAETAWLLAAMLVVAVLASWALYAFVERPITRRWSTPRSRPPDESRVPSTSATF
ncbi:acyltransferase family protein [Streptomyces boninensis]|uniref:acyltransferase family protein n=1 Tax=Streptomyces boninensis TaxID=2039455 RepID=UPI003B220756